MSHALAQRSNIYFSDIQERCHFLSYFYSLQIEKDFIDALFFFFFPKGIESSLPASHFIIDMHLLRKTGKRHKIVPF